LIPGLVYGPNEVEAASSGCHQARPHESPVRFQRSRSFGHYIIKLEVAEAEQASVVSSLMDKPMRNLHFRFMTFCLKLRDLFSPPRMIVKEAGIRPMFVVLDFGCGPGSFSIAAAEMVGADGKVYGLDIHPFAEQMLVKAAARKGLRNIEAINSACETGLKDESVDVVLLYDTFHMLSEPRLVLKELHRVLKPGGVLSFNDHHMKEDEIISSVTDGGLFRMTAKGRRTYSFQKEKNAL